MLQWIIDWLGLNVSSGQTAYNTYYQYVVMAALIIVIIFTTEVLKYIRLAITSLFNIGKDKK